MPMIGAKDTLVAKPKFPKERTEHSTYTVSANAATFPTSTIGFPPGPWSTNVANGWVANGVNIGNTAGTVGFNEVGPYVVNVTATSVTLSQAIGGNIAAGAQITFSKPLLFAGIKANTLANTYNANTYLVSSTRKANANNNLAGPATQHIGWNYITVGTGFVKSVAVKTAGNQMSNGYLVFTANTQYPGGSGANASFTVNANGFITSITMNSNGSGYVLTPTVTAPFTGNVSNAVNATFTVTMGGRANRIQAETLAVLSNISVSDANSGGIWFKGL